MNYMEPSQFRIHHEMGDGVYLLCTICQGCIPECVEDLQDAIKQADLHAQHGHDCRLRFGAKPATYGRGTAPLPLWQHACGIVTANNLGDDQEPSRCPGACSQQGWTRLYTMEA